MYIDCFYQIYGRVPRTVVQTEYDVLKIKDSIKVKLRRYVQIQMMFFFHSFFLVHLAGAVEYTECISEER